MYVKKAKLILTVALFFSSFSSFAQNDIVYQNLAAHLDRQITKQVGIYIGRSWEELNTLAYALKNDKEVTLSLKKLDTNYIVNSKRTLQENALEIYFTSYNPGAELISPALLLHFSEINSFVNQRMDSLQANNIEYQLDSHFFDKSLALFYKDSFKVKALHSIVKNENLGSKNQYQQHKISVLRLLAKQSKLAREKIIAQVFSIMSEQWF